MGKGSNHGILHLLLPVVNAVGSPCRLPPVVTCILFFLSTKDWKTCPAYFPSVLVLHGVYYLVFYYVVPTLQYGPPVSCFGLLQDDPYTYLGGRAKSCSQKDYHLSNCRSILLCTQTSVYPSVQLQIYIIVEAVY